MDIFKAAVVQTINQYRPLPGSGVKLMECRDAILQANLQHNIQLITHAHRHGVRIICLGKFFHAPYFALEKEPHWLVFAETIEGGETVRCLRQVSEELGMIIIAPIFEYDPVSKRRYSTAVVLQDGRLLGKYRKRNIPSGANEIGGFYESYYIAPENGSHPDQDCGRSYDGRNMPVFNTKAGRIGIIICYDRHFPEGINSLAAQHADIVFCPSVTFGRDSRRLWKKEFEVDAARYQLVIGACNRSGTEPPWNVEYFGESLFMGPQGPLENISDHRNLVIAQIDLSSVRNGSVAGWDLSRNRQNHGR